MSKLLIKDSEGDIIAFLYFNADGSLNEDSWLCPEGWKKRCLATGE